MERGWVKVWRKCLDNPYFGNPKYVALWIHILMLATHKEIDMIFNKARITLRPGQFITGRKSLSKRSGIAQTTIERLLEIMESEHQIGQQKTTKNRLITVLNWDKYQKDGQQNGQQADNKRTQTRTKEHKEVTTPPSGDDGFQEFWELYPRKVAKKKALQSWMKLKPSLEVRVRIQEAVSAALTSPQWTKDDGRFIPHAATWLNQERWEDEETKKTEPRQIDAEHNQRLKELGYES